MGLDLLRGKVAVVTGAHRGIGLAILERFVQCGADVRVVNRRADPAFSERCRALEQGHGVRISACFADFADEAQVKDAARALCAMKPAPDILVNNVGIAGSTMMFTMTKMEAVRRSFEVNLFSAIALTQALSRQMMRQKRGSIIFLSSSAAFDGGAGIDYSASKAAVIGAARRMAVELGKFGIRVNALAPGLTRTDMGAVTSQADQAQAASRAVLGRIAEPSEIADAAAFLASDLSRFVTGQVLRVDGGILR